MTRIYKYGYVQYNIMNKDTCSIVSPRTYNICVYMARVLDGYICICLEYIYLHMTSVICIHVCTRLEHLYVCI